MDVLRSQILDQIPGIQYGFGTAIDSIPLPLLEIWKKHKPFWHQIHGVRMAHVSHPGQACGEVDALYAEAQQLPIGVMTADCVPILMAQRSGECVAAVHAGWRGTKQRILKGIWQDLKSLGHRPQDWVAVVGPSNRVCCYEVSESLIQEFIQEFPEIDPKRIEPQFRRLDLAQVNAAELEAIGLAAIEVLPVCTFCYLSSQASPLFHSHRRDQRFGISQRRQYSIVMRS